MLQQVKVTSDIPASIKPLLQAAIRSQMRTLEHGIQPCKERHAAFEDRFPMDSGIFLERFDIGELEETLDYIEWVGEIKTLQLLQDQMQSLESAKIK